MAEDEEKARAYARAGLSGGGEAVSAPDLIGLLREARQALAVAQDRLIDVGIYEGTHEHREVLDLIRRIDHGLRCWDGGEACRPRKA